VAARLTSAAYIGFGEPVCVGARGVPHCLLSAGGAGRLLDLCERVARQDSWNAPTEGP
jgi:hypothetical protein